MAILRSIRSWRQGDSRRKLVNGQSTRLHHVRALLRWPTIVAACFWGLATVIVVSGDDRSAYYLNMKVTQPVLARVYFERVNETRTAELRKKAAQDVPNYFRLNQAVVDGIQAAFRDLHAAVKAAEDYEKYRETYGERWPLDQVAFDTLKTFTDDAGSVQFKEKVDGLAQRLARENMLERAELSLDREVRSTAGEVKLDRGTGKPATVPKEKLTYASNPDHVRRLAEDLVQYVFSPELKPAMISIVEQEIIPDPKEYRPIFVYDREATRAKIDEALAGLSPVVDAYEPGELLVKSGVLDEQGLSLLKAEQKEYLRQRDVDPDLRSQWRKQRVGLAGILLLITAGLSFYTATTQPRIVQRPARTITLASLFLLMLLADRLALGEVGSSPMWSVMTVAMAAAILTISYSQRYAFGATTALALLTIVTIEAPPGTILVYLSVAASAVLLLREVRTRLRMVVVGFLAAVAGLISAFLVGLADQQNVSYVLVQATYAALAALAGICIVLVLLPVIEKVFRITTSLTLLEWADTSQPLLRQLIEKAPGTWQHSHLLGSMAETAAEEIGANGLLVRVGAYYHDIGKICKSNYFVENQQAKINAHRGLAPTMSLLVILTHVKDGLALAREHRLPPSLFQFIAEHHGTTVVKYFHAMAAQEARASGQGREVSDTEFRYPGPKPSSRESAILMLCDGVEGAVRALHDPTPGRIENVVHDITMARLMDGQFDNCDITLKELSRVEQSLVRSLRAIHHGRIAYPDQKADPPSASQLRSA